MHHTKKHLTSPVITNEDLFVDVGLTKEALPCAQLVTPVKRQQDREVVPPGT